jgi:uncharacterized protein (TIGR03435 family)
MAEAIAGTLYSISHGESHAVRPGQNIENGVVIRADGDGGALVLADGSRIEMRASSEVALEQANDGVRIRLTTGSVIVNAAPQPTGHLYVQTRDVTVSVIGTVFLVESAETGSRVAVIQGEVHVQQGTTSKKLLPGEQVTTAPSMKPVPVADEISWSRHVEEHLALLEHAAAVAFAVPSQNRQGRQTFESVSVRSTASGRAPGGGGGARGGTGGGAIQGTLGLVLRPECSGRIVVDPGRIVMTGITLYNIIALAYGMDCRDAKLADLISGGAAWVKSDRFDIEAVIPDGTPVYTSQQLTLRHNAPILQQMLQTMLSERFRLAVRRESRETSIYNLIVVDDGKLKVSEDQSRNYFPADTRQQAMRLGSDFLQKGMLVAGGHLGMIVEESGSAIMRADAAEIPLMFTLLYTQIKDRMIVDKTNLNGQFDFTVQFAATYRIEGPQAGSAIVPPPAGPTIFDALQEQVGLKLDPARVPMEVLFIDRAEKPAEN